MTDIALNWDPIEFAGELLLDAGQLATDDGMRTAILISLFSDARAPDDAELPEQGGDRRGWWGDAYAVGAMLDAGTARDPNRIGSLLWLLSRAKATGTNLQLARQYCAAALAWLVRDGVAASIEVEVEAQHGVTPRSRLAIAVFVTRPHGPDRQRFDFTWEASA